MSKKKWSDIKLQLEAIEEGRAECILGCRKVWSPSSTLYDHRTGRNKKMVDDLQSFHMKRNKKLSSAMKYSSSLAFH